MAIVVQTRSCITHIHNNCVYIAYCILPIAYIGNNCIDCLLLITYRSTVRYGKIRYGTVYSIYGMYRSYGVYNVYSIYSMYNMYSMYSMYSMSIRMYVCMDVL